MSTPYVVVQHSPQKEKLRCEYDLQCPFCSIAGGFVALLHRTEHFHRDTNTRDRTQNNALTTRVHSNHRILDGMMFTSMSKKIERSFFVFLHIEEVEIQESAEDKKER